MVCNLQTSYTDHYCPYSELYLYQESAWHTIKQKSNESQVNK